MAGYRMHITTSSFLGVGVGIGAVLGFGYTPAQGVVAACLTGIGGMLPDLDSQSGRPVREIFGLTAALAPMLMMRRLMEWSAGDTDRMMVLAIGMYVAIRYGAAWLLGKVTVHRGMYHSIPALIIAAELAFLGYKSEFVSVKTLMGVGVAIGFASHLVLDELYAVEWNGQRLRLNKFAGSASKFFGKTWGPNIITYGLLFTMTFGIFVDGGLISPPGTPPAMAAPQPVGSLPSAVNHSERVERIDLRRQ
jgi:hypothetical protein